MDEIINALAKCALFRDIAPEQIAVLQRASDCTVKIYRKDEAVCRTGEEFSSLGFIVSGCLELRKYLSTGNAVSVFHREPGEMIGGFIIFADHPVSPYDIVAKEDSRLMLVRKASVLGVLFKDPAVAANMMRIYANRIAQFEKRLELFTYSSIRQKIAFSLLNDFQAEDGGTVLLPFTKTVWAEYLNVSRPSLSRELTVLCKQGALAVHGRKIDILKKDLLEEILFE